MSEYPTERLLFVGGPAHGTVRTVRKGDNGAAVRVAGEVDEDAEWHVHARYLRVSVWYQVRGCAQHQLDVMTATDDERVLTDAYRIARAGGWSPGGEA